MGCNWIAVAVSCYLNVGLFSVYTVTNVHISVCVSQTKERARNSSFMVEMTTKDPADYRTTFQKNIFLTFWAENARYVSNILAASAILA